MDEWMDQRLHIQTAGVREWVHQLAHYNRYEATPYDAMDFLFSRHPVLRSGSWIDFGCGKGRVSFYVHYTFELDVTGIEMNHVLFQDAMNNLMAYRQAFPKKAGSVTFDRGLAEQTAIPSDAAVFYFFNPFSVDIFRAVIRNIVRSLEENPRDAEIILYYPTTAYLLLLEAHEAFEKTAEILIDHLAVRDSNERFIVYAYKKYRP